MSEYQDLKIRLKWLNALIEERKPEVGMILKTIDNLGNEFIALGKELKAFGIVN